MKKSVAILTGTILALNALAAPVVHALQPRIINSTIETEWNGYTVGIHLYDSYKSGIRQGEENPTMKSQYCTGTLISPSTVLTAAWCVTNYENHKFIEKINSDQIFVTADFKLNSNSEKYKVLTVNVHPKYSPMKLSNDIAVLKLVTPIENSKPVNLGSTQSLTEAAVYGWGATLPNWENSGYGFTETLQKGIVTILPENVCSGKKSFILNGKALFPNSTKEVRKNIKKFHCALGVTDEEIDIYEKSKFVDPCYADTGTGLIDPSTNSIVGIALHDLGCAGATPKLYSKTKAYLGFIKKFIN
jgi:secreted trypsin-like serine protease